MYSGPRLNQEKKKPTTAELAQICLHKNVFLAQSSPSEALAKVSRTFADERNKLPSFGNHARFVGEFELFV